jgi:hypothetical protein
VIEVQTGGYLGEDYIIRFEDDYGTFEEIERVEGCNSQTRIIRLCTSLVRARPTPFLPDMSRRCAHDSGCGFNYRRSNCQNFGRRSVE